MPLRLVRVRAALAPLLALCATTTPLRAQNGSNYHALTNGGDVAYFGIGAGGAQAPADGLGTWVDGEDLRGSRLTQLGDFGYRMHGFTEWMCVFGPDPGGGLDIDFSLVLFLELHGLDPNTPPVFTNPACTTPSFPLGASGIVPYGLAPGTSASFVLAAVPSSVGSGAVLVPNGGLLPSTAGGTVALAGGVAGISLPINSTGFCWAVNFTWTPSALALHDDIDGLWHWVGNSPDGNQYWTLSSNEQNLWQSFSVGSDTSLATTKVLTANVDYALNFDALEPVTLATLAPRAGVTPYSAWTTYVGNEYGVVLHPNGGFDVGRGSEAISISGTAGVPNPVTGVGNQDPSLAPGTLATLGFATWDNGGDHNGSVRLTWLSVDLLQLAGGHPSSDPGVLKGGGTLRLPVVSAGLLQPLTSAAFGLFGHVTQWGFVWGYPPSGTFDMATGGASWQVPLTPLPAACLGTAANITYGTTGRKGSLGAPGGLTFDPAIAAISGSRQLFLFD